MVVLINTVIVWMLALVFPNRFHAEHLIWALAAGLVSGLLITLLDDVFGLSPPIVEGGPASLRREIARAKPGHREEKLLDAAARGKHKLDGSDAESDLESSGEEQP